MQNLSQQLSQPRRSTVLTQQRAVRQGSTCRLLIWSAHVATCWGRLCVLQETAEGAHGARHTVP